MARPGCQFRDEGYNIKKIMTDSFLTVENENESYRLPLWLAFLLYLLLTLGFTYPAILHLSSRVIGGGDAYMFLWDIW